MVIDAQKRLYLRASVQGAALAGLRVRVARLGRGWSEMASAERAGMSRATLQKIERGDPSVAFGLVLDACAVLDLPLFGHPNAEASARIEQARLRLEALPRRVRAREEAPDDAF